MKPDKKKFAWLLIAALLLASCKSPAPQAPSATPVDADAIYTAAAETAAAMMTEIAGITPTPPPVADTPAPTEAQPTDSGIATPGGGAVPGAGSAKGDHAEFSKDVTVPDGTVMMPNEAFVKTWELMNAGTTTWTKAYSVVYYDGNVLGSSGSVPMPLDVAPGQLVEVSVYMVAPAEPGIYSSYWMLKNAEGKLFGIGPNADQPFYTQISVAGAGGTPGTPNATAGPGATNYIVKNAKVSLNPDTWYAACPGYITVNASFTLAQAATVSYRLEAVGSYQIPLPDPTTAALPAGTHSLVYTLEFMRPFDGAVRLHVLEPEEVVSNLAVISVVCRR